MSFGFNKSSKTTSMYFIEGSRSQKPDKQSEKEASSTGKNNRID